MATSRAATHNFEGKALGKRQATDAEILARVRASARIADDKQADDILVLDLRGLTSVTDYFVIATGRNPRQLHAIADEVYFQQKAESHMPLGRDGDATARWIVLDYGDFVLHLFDVDARKLYDLELLWGDAPRVDWA